MLNALDLVAVVIALATSLTLIITSAIQNARLTRSRDQWRADCLEARGLLAKHANCEPCRHAEVW